MKFDTLQTEVDAVKKDMGLGNDRKHILQHEFNVLLFDKQRMLVRKCCVSVNLEYLVNLSNLAFMTIVDEINSIERTDCNVLCE